MCDPGGLPRGADPPSEQGPAGERMPRGCAQVKILSEGSSGCAGQMERSARSDCRAGAGWREAPQRVFLLLQADWLPRNMAERPLTTSLSNLDSQRPAVDTRLVSAHRVTPPLRGHLGVATPQREVLGRMPGPGWLSLPGARRTLPGRRQPAQR